MDSHNKGQNLESSENLNSSLRESKANEAICNTESKSVESKINNNKIYNFLFHYNLNERRSPKKCDKFHSFGLQGIVGKWRSPFTKGDFKGGTLPPLYNTHEVRIIGEATHQNDKNNSNEVAARDEKSENEAE